jgi:hypothetical protein
MWSSAEIPAGTLVARIFTQVASPAGTSSHDIVIVPEYAGLSETRVTAWTTRTLGTISTNRASTTSDSAVLPQAKSTDIYLTALGIVLTVVYGLGLITRPHRQLLRMGMDSLAVLVLYAAGIAGLIAVTSH